MHPPKKVDPSRANRGTRRPTAHRKPSYQPAEPKCVRCGHDMKWHVVDDTVDDPDPSELWCQACDGPNQCPPTTEPAESEGKACDWCSRPEGKPHGKDCPTAAALLERLKPINDPLIHEMLEHVNALPEDSPTAPPAESVEDAQELADAQGYAREFFARWEHNEFYSAVAYSGYKHATEKQAEIMAQFAIEYATKQIERQTPAIIERFVEEVEKELTDEWYGEGIEAALKAMQTVIARREGGEGK